MPLPVVEAMLNAIEPVNQINNMLPRVILVLYFSRYKTVLV